MPSKINKELREIMEELTIIDHSHLLLQAYKQIPDSKNLIIGEMPIIDELGEILRNTKYLVSILNDMGHFLYINNAWTLYLGWTLQEMRHKIFTEFLHADDVEKSIKALTDVVYKKVDISKYSKFQNRYISKNGKYKHVNWFIYNQFDYSISNQPVFLSIAEPGTPQTPIQFSFLNYAQQCMLKYLWGFTCKIYLQVIYLGLHLKPHIMKQELSVIKINFSFTPQEIAAAEYLNLINAINAIKSEAEQAQLHLDLAQESAQETGFIDMETRAELFSWVKDYRSKINKLEALRKEFTTRYLDEKKAAISEFVNSQKQLLENPGKGMLALIESFDREQKRLAQIKRQEILRKQREAEEKRKKAEELRKKEFDLVLSVERNGKQMISQATTMAEIDAVIERLESGKSKVPEKFTLPEYQQQAKEAIDVLIKLAKAEYIRAKDMENAQNAAEVEAAEVKAINNEPDDPEAQIAEIQAAQAAHIREMQQQREAAEQEAQRQKAAAELAEIEKRTYKNRQIKIVSIEISDPVLAFSHHFDLLKIEVKRNDVKKWIKRNKGQIPQGFAVTFEDSLTVNL